nr:PREDICTED: uncharacterized protein LOC108204095 [Daucus carota subsp. sativus]XP_017228878.1 PREDICTED: uncharacterized protein LOC108204096 [Daucus carota subsp. sativus]
MNDHEASTSGIKNEIELTQFPFRQQRNDHEASTSGTKDETEPTQFSVENYSDSDEDFDRYTYVYEIDENAEGQVISSAPSNVQVPTPPVIIPPAHVNPPPNRHSFRVITFIFCICLLISSVFFISTYVYIKLTSHKVVLQPSTANLISFSANNSHRPFNVTFSYSFYNPNYEYNLDVHDETVVLDSLLLPKRLATSFRDLSLQPRQQKDVDFNFFTKNPDLRLDSDTERLSRNNRYFFKLTVKVRMRISLIYFPLSFYSSKVNTCQFRVEGQPPTGSVPIEKISCQ